MESVLAVWVDPEQKDVEKVRERIRGVTGIIKSDIVLRRDGCEVIVIDVNGTESSVERLENKVRGMDVLNLERLYTIQ
mgnify:CR=1 FL=1